MYPITGKVNGNAVAGAEIAAVVVFGLAVLACVAAACVRCCKTRQRRAPYTPISNTTYA